jgi:hypothetical protein
MPKPRQGVTLAEARAREFVLRGMPHLHARRRSAK